MRVALVTAAFRARSPIDLASHVRILAPALARAGASVEVFAGTTGSGLSPYAQRRQELIEPVTGRSFGVTTIELEEEPDEGRLAEAFAAFLDRERPSVCHFEQLDPVGVGVIREAKRRRISTIYSAHDTWAAHDRTSLTLPDLTPFDLGDTEAEARSLAARRVMQSEGLMTSAPFGEDSAEKERCERMRHLLHDELTDPAEAAALRDAREAVEVRRAQKRIALSAVDRRFAVSRLLSRELSAAVGRAFTFRAAGIDQTVLASIVATEPRDSSGSGYATVDFAAASAGDGGGEYGGADRAPGPVRLVYMGTTDPTRGLDVLLDAISLVRGDEDVPEAVWRFALERTDDVRDAQIHARAEKLGVDIVWTRSASVDVRSALDGADALVLPSLWGEVAPVEVRLALGCAVPIVASRMPGVVEAAPSTASVLFPPGNVDALADTLKKLASEGGATALRSLRSAAVNEKEMSTKSIDDEALEWLDTYASLVESADALGRARAKAALAGPNVDEAHPAFGAPSGPPKVQRQEALVEVEEQIASFRKLSNTELFARAQEGIGRLRKAFGLRDSESTLLGRVVARGGAVRDRAEHDATTRREVARALEDLRLAQRNMHAEEAVRSRRIADLQQVLEQYEHEVQARAEEAAHATSLVKGAQTEAESARAEAEAAVSSEEKAKARAQELADAAESLRGDLSDMGTQLESAASERDALQAERDEVKAQLDAAGDPADRQRLEESISESEGRYRVVAAQAEAAKAALESAESARDELKASIDQRALEIRSLRDRVVQRSEDDEATDQSVDDVVARDATADLESIEAYCVALERDLEALQRNDTWVADEADRMIDSLAAASSGDEDSGSGMDLTAASLKHLTLELDWRRDEMEGALVSAKSMRARFLAGPLASRVRAWTSPPVDVVTTMSALSDSRPGSASNLEGEATIGDERPTTSEQPEPRAPLPTGSAVGEDDGSSSDSSSEATVKSQAAADGESDQEGTQS